MRNSRVLIVLVALSLLVAGGTALAQGIPTATLTGRVINEGQGLPGVSVVAKSPALQGSRTSVTGINGDYKFINVPPGDYTVSFSLSGFQTQTKTIKLAASQVSRLDVMLGLAAVEASATVVGQGESISQTSQAATTYSGSEMAKLPTSRTITGTVSLTPGVTGGVNGPQIAGAPSIENLYTVNGVVVVDNVRTTPNDLYIEDAVQETTTMTSGVSAEFGRFSGGVVNTITKSGGNTFSGSFRTTLTNDAWRAYSAYRTSTGVNPQEGTFNNKVLPTYEATFGGPIVKDVLWFFLAGRYQDRSTGTTSITQYTNIPYTGGREQTRGEGKLTFSPFQSHTITGSYVGVQSKDFNYTQFAGYDLDILSDRQLPQSLLAINYNGVLSDSFFLDAQYSQRKFEFQNSGGRYTDFVQGTPIWDYFGSGYLANAAYYCGVCETKQRNNDNYLIKGTYFLSSKSLGSHSIVGGYDDFGGQRFEPNNQSASNWVLYPGSYSIIQGTSAYPIVDPNTEIDYWPVFASGWTNIRTRSAFINDSWRLNNNLSFNVGVRYDKNDAKDPLGVTTSNDSAWSPRLAATYDPKGNGAFRVTASYAKYVSALQDTEATDASGGNAPADFWWYFDKADSLSFNTDPTKPLTSAREALRQIQTYFTNKGCYPDPLAKGCSLPFDSGRYSGYSLQLRDSLSSPYAEEIAVGVSGNFSTRGTFRADVVRRQYKNFYDTRRDMSTGRVSDPVGNIYDLGLIEISNDYKREYTGLHTQFAYRFGDGLSLGGNWTWSHLIGDAEQESSGSGSVRQGSHSYPEYKVRSWNNPVGSLSADRRHRVNLYGTYDLPVPKFLGKWDINILQSFQTGVPYSANGLMDTRPYVTNPGYYRTSDAGGAVTYYYTPRDYYRTEQLWSTDLSLNINYRIANTVELYVSPQVYNLFNSQHITSPNTTVSNYRSSSATFARFNPFTTTPIECPQGTAAAACKAMGANYQLGSSFGQATSAGGYQSPRTFQMMVGLRF